MFLHVSVNTGGAGRTGNERDLTRERALKEAV